MNLEKEIEKLKRLANNERGRNLNSYAAGQLEVLKRWLADRKALEDEIKTLTEEVGRLKERIKELCNGNVDLVEQIAKKEPSLTPADAKGIIKEAEQEIEMLNEEMETCDYCKSKRKARQSDTCEVHFRMIQPWNNRIFFLKDFFKSKGVDLEGKQ